MRVQDCTGDMDGVVIVHTSAWLFPKGYAGGRDRECHGVLPRLVYPEICAGNPAGFPRSSGEYGVTVAPAEKMGLPHPTVLERSHPVALEGETSRPAASMTSANPIMIFPKSI